MNLSNHWLMVRFSLSLDNIRSWRKIYVREKSKESDKFKEIYNKKMQKVKLVKMLKKPKR